MYTEFKDYYSLLQIGFRATPEEIKTAYRKMAREYHPDMHPEETEAYTKAFQELTEAYETLSDPLKKLNYDYRYRELVLQEVPAGYDIEAYYAVETPPDNTVYEHRYTSRDKKSFPFVKVGMLLVLLFQILRLLLQAAPVEPDKKPASTVVTPQSIQELLQRTNSGQGAH